MLCRVSPGYHRGDTRHNPVDTNIEHRSNFELRWQLTSRAIMCLSWTFLTHWGRVTHICVGNLTIIGPDNGLSPGRRQAIIWINAGILLIGLRGTNFSEISIGIQKFSFKKMHLKTSSAKWRPFCLVLNLLTQLALLYWGCTVPHTGSCGGGAVVVLQNTPLMDMLGLRTISQMLWVFWR